MRHEALQHFERSLAMFREVGDRENEAGATENVGNVLFYVGRMPYYQRLYANALSRSIRAAVTLGEQRDICSRDWQQILPRREFMLLSGANS